MARTKRTVCPSMEAPRKRMASDLLSVHVRFAASGETLVTLRLRPQMVVTEVRENVNRSLELGLVATSLLQGAGILSESARLGDLTSEGSIEVTLDVVVTLETALCMSQPCAAGDLLDIVRAADRQRRHCDMSRAPSAAKAVAESLRAAAPDLESIQMIGGNESGDGGQVIVIANPGREALWACRKALAIVDELPNEEGEQEEDDEDEEQEQEEIPHYWLLQKRIPGRLRHPRFQDRLEVGFNRDECGEEERVESQLQAVTQIMCDKLSRHFKFHFDGPAGKKPVIFGGFCEDGSIVGVLTSGVYT
mmetsp:Transcript_19979/g.46887  ORF Transcript_19979/g.46887 Transcript_19979/m.46887 type:complete len:306 (-) Transcript_19979:35-952(-)